MFWQGPVGRCEVILPTRRRRLIMLAAAILAGGGLAYTVPHLVGWSDAIVVVLGLATLAGVSLLWSP